MKKWWEEGFFDETTRVLERSRESAKANSKAWVLSDFYPIGVHAADMFLDEDDGSMDLSVAAWQYLDLQGKLQGGCGF